MQKQGKHWTKEEDEMLVEFYKQADCFQKWKYVSSLFKESGILKTQLQCRDRFVNFINPKLKPGKLAQAEIVKLFECYNEYGPQWSLFENKIRGRSQNKLKNQFYSALRSLLRMFIKVGQKRNLCPFEIKFQKIRVKNLLDLYQGRKNYIRIKTFFKECLENIGYSIKRHKLQNYFNLQSPEYLKTIFLTIYDQTEAINFKKIKSSHASITIEEMKKDINAKEQNEHSTASKPGSYEMHPSSQLPVVPEDQACHNNVYAYFGIGLPLQFLPTQYAYYYYYP